MTNTGLYFGRKHATLKVVQQMTIIVIFIDKQAFKEVILPTSKWNIIVYCFQVFSPTTIWKTLVPMSCPNKISYYVIVTLLLKIVIYGVLSIMLWAVSHDRHERANQQTIWLPFRQDLFLRHTFFFIFSLIYEINNKLQSPCLGELLIFGH